MKINPELTLREMAGEYIIVNPFSDTVDMTQIYTMNETAAWLWQQMEGKEFTAEDIAEALCADYCLWSRLTCTEKLSSGSAKDGRGV